MNTRSFALVLLKLMLACFTGLPAIAVAQVATDRFAWVTLVDHFCCACSQYCFDYRTAGIAVQAFGYQIVLTQDPADGAPSWSPDGTRIAFQRAGEIMVINATGGTPANITNHPATDGLPAWSPDGTRIAFLSDRDGQSSQPYLMNVDGSGVVRLTNGIPVRGRIAWSPDGAKIAFDCEVDPGNFDICSINTDGTGFARLTSDPGYDSGPSWSPDGSRIAFSTNRFGGVCVAFSDEPFAFVDPNELAIMNADGTGFIRVGPAGTPGSGPSWSPDGNRIVFEVARYYDCRYVASSIVQINTDGTLATGIGTGFSAAWGPATLTPSSPAVALSPASLSFVSSVGFTSSPKTTQLLNFGSSELTVSSIVASGEFAQTNTCSGTLVPGAYCMITVTFTPTASGTRSGAVTITDSAPGSPHVIPLSGVGNFPPIAKFTSNCIELTCTFDGSASTDPDGSIRNWNWNYGDLTFGFGSPTVSHTYAAGGTYPVTLTVSDGWATATQSTSVTVSPKFMHVGDLDGASEYQNKAIWIAKVTVTVHERSNSHKRVTNATVKGNWTNVGTSSCTTDVSGQCTVSTGIQRRTGSVTFTVSDVTHALTYTSTDNHDADGDSNGTTITVMRP